MTPLTLQQPSTLIYDLRILFVFVGVLLCLFTTGLFIWLLSAVPKVRASQHYKTLPYLTASGGLALMINSLFGYLGYIVWKTRDYPNPPHSNAYLLTVPIVLGSIIWIIGTFIHFRQFGKSYLSLIARSQRQREYDEHPQGV